MSGSNREFRRCPRCWAAMFEVGRGALSRTTRDEGALIEVCPRCGAREALYGNRSAAQPPFEDWPLTVERLVDEERQLITMDQRGEMSVMTIAPRDARRMLGEPTDEGEDAT